MIIKTGFVDLSSLLVAISVWDRYSLSLLCLSCEVGDCSASNLGGLLQECILLMLGTQHMPSKSQCHLDHMWGSLSPRPRSQNKQCRGQAYTGGPVLKEANMSLKGTTECRYVRLCRDRQSSGYQPGGSIPFNQPATNTPFSSCSCSDCEGGPPASR